MTFRTRVHTGILGHGAKQNFLGHGEGGGGGGHTRPLGHGATGL